MGPGGGEDQSAVKSKKKPKEVGNKNKRGVIHRHLLTPMSGDKSGRKNSLVRKAEEFEGRWV